MEKRNTTIEKIMTERFGKDCIIALATAEDNIPYVRGVNAFYKNGAFYVMIHTMSNKVRQIEKNPNVSVSGKWFTSQGTAKNIGAFHKPENLEIAEKLKTVFADWLKNSGTDLTDQNVCILCVKLTKGIVSAQGKRYEIDFSAEL